MPRRGRIVNLARPRPECGNMNWMDSFKANLLEALCNPGQPRDEKGRCASTGGGGVGAGGSGEASGAPEIGAVWKNPEHQTASQKSGKVPDGTPEKTRTLYHVTTTEGAKGIMESGFDLDKVSPRWNNDLAVSLAKSAKQAAAWVKSDDAVLLQVKVKGRLFDSIGSPNVRATSPMEYTKKMVAQGLDGQVAGTTVYVHNPSAVASIKRVKIP